MKHTITIGDYTVSSESPIKIETGWHDYVPPEQKVSAAENRGKDNLFEAAKQWTKNPAAQARSEIPDCAHLDSKELTAAAKIDLLMQLDALTKPPSPDHRTVDEVADCYDNPEDFLAGYEYALKEIERAK